MSCNWLPQWGVVNFDASTVTSVGSRLQTQAVTIAWELNVDSDQEGGETEWCITYYSHYYISNTLIDEVGEGTIHLQGVGYPVRPRFVIPYFDSQARWCGL